jgi:hypothetical protein
MIAEAPEQVKRFNALESGLRQAAQAFQTICTPPSIWWRRRAMKR